MITQEYFLDMIPGESTPPVVHVSQFDVKSRTLTFNLMKGGVAYVPDAGVSVTLDGMKPDNTVFSYPMTVNGSSVSIDVLTQMTVVAGPVRCEVSLSNQTGKIGSANFILAVERSPIDSGSISESDIPIFEDLKNQAQQAAADAEQSASDAEGFAADAETAASSVSAILPASAGSPGQVLTKTATGADWETIDATDIETSSGVAIKSVNGNPVTITDALQGNALGVIATLEPIQDLHGYDHPWAGGAGKNKLEVTATTATSKGVTFTVNDDGSVKVEGTTNTTNVYFNLNYTSGVKNIPVGTWKMGLLSDDPRIGLRAYAPENVGEAFGMNFQTITVGDDATQSNARIQIVNSVGITLNTTVYPMILSNDETDTSWEPYSNICPITGRISVDVNRTGKNLCPPVTIGRGYDPRTGKEISSAPSASSVKFLFDKDKTYTFTKNCDVNAMFLAWDAQDNFVGRTTGNNAQSRVITKSSFTAKGEGTGDLDSIAKIAIRFYESDNQNINDVTDAEYQIEEGDTATPYEEYKGQSITVQLGQTVYGGTLDVTNGVLTVNLAMVDLGTLSWTKVSGSTSQYDYFFAPLTPRGVGSTGDVVCSQYVGTSALSPTAGGNGEIRIVNGNEVRVRDLSYSDATIFKTAMSGVQLVYELATPQTIQLTPAQIQLLTGTNIITTNVDDLSVMYYATGKGDVEGSLAYLSEKKANTSTLATVESTSTASKAYSVGDYLMLNNIFCKVTAAISTGESIIVGSNVQYTTVAEELMAILAQINA